MGFSKKPSRIITAPEPPTQPLIAPEPKSKPTRAPRPAAPQKERETVPA